MTEAEQGFDIRRIVVAVDSSSHAAAALEAAANLAAALHAELEGVFVQDINLTRLAALPVGREIQFITGRARDFTAAALDDQNREQESSLRRALAAAATRLRVTHRFRVAQGQVEAEVISAAGAADLLIIGTGGWSRGGRGRLGSTARAAMERAPHSVLLSKIGMRSLRAPLVCYDGAAGSKRALEAAVRILPAGETRLAILIIAGEPEKAEALRRETEERLAALTVKPAFLYSEHPAPDQVCRFAAEAGADILIIGADCDLIAGTDRLSVLESIACPVLLVR